jgi:predicted small lipoprotein YifL
MEVFFRGAQSSASGLERTWMTLSFRALRSSRRNLRALKTVRTWPERFWPLFLIALFFLSGCGSEPPKPTPEAAKKTAGPAVTQDVQDAATALLGSDTQVLLYGDLAKNGQKQMLAANVVPNTPKSTVAGTVVTRAIVAENVDGKWTELFRADEYLKNQNGYLALTPLQAVTGWKLQYENSEDKGMSLYFTPVQQGTSQKTLPIAVRWNPAQKRYQSMDLSYQHFLNESPSIGSPRSALR